MRRPVDEHEGERQAGVDGAVRQAVDERLDELVDSPRHTPRYARLIWSSACSSAAEPSRTIDADLEEVGPLGELQRQLGVLLDDHRRHAELARRRGRASRRAA